MLFLWCVCALFCDTCVEVRKQLAGVISSFYSVGLGMELRSSGLVALLPTRHLTSPGEEFRLHIPHRAHQSVLLVSPLPTFPPVEGQCLF